MLVENPKQQFFLPGILSADRNVVKQGSVQGEADFQQDIARDSIGVNLH